MGGRPTTSANREAADAARLSSGEREFFRTEKPSPSYLLWHTVLKARYTEARQNISLSLSLSGVAMSVCAAGGALGRLGAANRVSVEGRSHLDVVPVGGRGREELGQATGNG